MSAHRYVTLDVFTSTRFGGNQLAVFPDATSIPEELLLPITREFNYSETTFCYPPVHAEHTARVRIFTPGGEVPFAGHPTVGTAIAIFSASRVARSGGENARLVLEEGVGPIVVTVRAPSGSPAFAQFSVAKLPEIGPEPVSRAVLADVLSLDEVDILQSPWQPQALSCGIPFLMVPVQSVGAVSRARVRLDLWEQHLKGTWTPELFVFSHDPAGGPTHLRARMFAPGLSVPEDPATGSACACLAGYLAHRAASRDGTLTWTVDQGVEMGRPSRIEIEADRTASVLRAVRVGGHAVPVSDGTLRIT